MIATHALTGRAVELVREGERLSPRPSTEGAEPDLYLSPGWIDVQVNGFGGVDVNDPTTTPDAFETMVRALQTTGVTRLLPTVITAPLTDVRRCLASVRRAAQTSPTVRAAVAGIHLEGPFVSPEDGARGAHPREHVLDPDPDLFDTLQEAAAGTIRLVTLAPERPGALALIEHLRRQGVTVALGHTVADAEAVREAVAAGARLSTHLGNGVPATLPRHPNVLWSQLAEERLSASAIFDGHHLPPELMRVLYAVKGPGRLILTSDAVALAGRPPGTYSGQVGGTVHLAPNGRLTVAGSDYLAGSASSLLDGVRTAVDVVGMAPGDALRAVTRTPAELLGLEERDDWTVVRFGPQGRHRVATVAVAGRVVHDAAAPGPSGPRRA